MTKPCRLRTGLLLTVQPRYNEHAYDNTDLSKCVAAPILATCALKDVMPEVGGRGDGGGGLGGVNVCLSVIQT